MQIDSVASIFKGLGFAVFNIILAQKEFPFFFHVKNSTATLAFFMLKSNTAMLLKKAASVFHR